MDNISHKAITYFQAPKEYYWHWAEEGNLIEWILGATICYRDELIPILEEVSQDGLPPIGAILFTIIACKDQWGDDIQVGIQTYHKHAESMKVGDPEAIIAFLKMIGTLPKELRTGSKRIHLIRQIFKESSFKIEAPLAAELINYFKTGQLDSKTYTPGDINDRSATFYKDMLALLAPASRFTTVESLKNILETGVEEIPEPLPIEIPLAPIDEEKSLLEQLLEDPQTTGLAHLAKKLLAAFHIPIHTRGSSDQSYGGISDITNRGSFDKLLLSELAYEDQQLMARLVNNEALYYRHEEPPSPLQKERVILIDTSLRTWGYPRHFAIASALACSINIPKGIHTTAFALGKEGFSELDFSQKEGIWEAMKILNPALYCTEGLLSYIQSFEKAQETEHILIAEESLLSSKGFLLHENQLKNTLTYLITVNRSGDFQFYEYHNGTKKRLYQAKFDLPALLLKKSDKEHDSNLDENLPASMKKAVFPMYFPSGKLNFSEKFIRNWHGYVIMGVTEAKQVYLWTEGALRGAVEIIPEVEAGTYLCGRDVNPSEYYVLVKPTQGEVLTFYTASSSIQGDKQWNCVDIFVDPGNIESATFIESKYLEIKGDRHVLIDLQTGKRIPEISDYWLIHNQPSTRSVKLRKDFNKTLVQSRVNPGYSTIHRIRSVFISENGLLCVNKHQLVMGKLWPRGTEQTGLLWKVFKEDFPEERAAEIEKTVLMTDNHSLHFRVAQWPDGSQVVFDPRGLIHLKSSDPDLAEITIALVLQLHTACWTSDGKFCGSTYFYKASAAEKIEPEAFNLNYLQPFIQRIFPT